MKCSLVGGTAIQRVRPRCAKRVVEAEACDHPGQARPARGELPTLFAELSIALVPVPGEAALASNCQCQSGEGGVTRSRGPGSPLSCCPG